MTRIINLIRSAAFVAAVSLAVLGVADLVIDGVDSPASAQTTQCTMDEAKLLSVLTDPEGYAETLVSTSALGVDGKKGMFRMYANVETGTWTGVVSDLSGRHCVVAAGVGYTPATEAEKTSMGEPI